MDFHSFLCRRICSCYAVHNFLILSLFIFLFIPAKSFSNDADYNIDDETCLTCHDGLDQSLAATPHRLSSTFSDPAIEIKCAGCHEGAGGHVEDPSPENIKTPSGMVSTDVIKICTRCHKAHDQLDDYGFDSHSIEQISCADCHKVHGYDPSLLLDDRAKFCLRCHKEMKTRFTRNSNHPLLQGVVNCLSCHRFTSKADNNLAYDLTGTCRKCHPREGGPYPYEHEAVNSYSVEGSGCVECHDPHGSSNNRLLRQPGNQLCRQCHMPAGHSVAHGGIWARYACEQCHVDTHGSFVSNLFLDPNLPSKFSGDCYNVGCHSLVK